jgi:hypothetical protein
VDGWLDKECGWEEVVVLRDRDRESVVRVWKEEIHDTR